MSAFLVESEHRAARPAVREACSQSDAFKPRPPSPPFQPRCTGTDAEAQVGDDLFDFDAEIEPLLDVLVSKTLEQAHVEAEREGEMAALVAVSAAAAAARCEEAAAVATAEAVALATARERRVAQRAQRREAEARARLLAKAGSQQLARQLWPSVLEGACSALRAGDAWVEPAARQIEAVFWPWLMDRV
ncbi:unnamed protein product, partial [Phaeothamnion confervicola]